MMVNMMLSLFGKIPHFILLNSTEEYFVFLSLLQMFIESGKWNNILAFKRKKNVFVCNNRARKHSAQGRTGGH